VTATRTASETLISQPLILASASASRAALLSGAGVAFIQDPADVDETALKQSMGDDGQSGASIANALAVEKAQTVSNRQPGCLVIGADQMLECDGQWFDKPEDMAQAREALRSLRGKTHTLRASVCVVRDGAMLWSHDEAAHMTMRPFSDDFLDAYLSMAGARVLQSVGAYQLEGPGAQLFDNIDGDYFTILGLPLLPLLRFLRMEGSLRP
jgi:septum formation protein